MTTHQWARHSDAIEDARERQDTALVGRAVMWAIGNDRPEATDLYAALTGIFSSQGHCCSYARQASRAIENALDAYLEHKKGRVAE